MKLKLNKKDTSKFNTEYEFNEENINKEMKKYLKEYRIFNNNISSIKFNGIKNNTLNFIFKICGRHPSFLANLKSETKFFEENIRKQLKKSKQTTIISQKTNNGETWYEARMFIKIMEE